MASIPSIAAVWSGLLRRIQGRKEVILKESYRTKMHVFFESLSPSFARRGLSTQVGRARIGSSGSSPQHRISKTDSTSFIKNPLLTKARLVGHLSKT